MKTFTLIIAAFLFTFQSNQEVKNYLGIDESIKFSDTEFLLMNSERPNKNSYTQYYLPAKEELPTFNQLISVQLILTKSSTKDLVEQRMQELEKLKANDPTCEFKLTPSPNGKSFLLDFVVSETKNDQMTNAEFNLSRYEEVNVGKNSKGVLITAYRKRGYGTNIMSFFANLNEERIAYFNEMISRETLELNLIEE